MSQNATARVCASCARRLSRMGAVLAAWALVGFVPVMAELLSGHHIRTLCQISRTLTGPVGRILAWFSIGLFFVSSLVSLVLFGRGAMLSRRLVNGFRLLRVQVPEAIQQVVTEVGLADRFWLVRYPQRVALTVGLRRPLVVLSEEVTAGLSADELRAILLHEKAHLQQRDPLRRLLWSSLVSGFRIMPGFAAAADAAQACWELQADRYAIEQMGSTDALADALLKMAAPAPKGFIATPVSAGFADELTLRAQHLSGGDIEPQLTAAAQAATDPRYLRWLFFLALISALLPACLPQ